MRVVKRPNFNKKCSKAIIFDGRRPYIVNVEIGKYPNSFVDYDNSVVHLREDSPNIKTEFYFEIHHLYRPLLEPIWTPTLRTLADEDPPDDKHVNLAQLYANENKREKTIKKMMEILKPKRDERSVKTVKVINLLTELFFELGRPDDFLEHPRIRDHLIKHHRTPKEFLDAIEKDELDIYDYIHLCVEKLHPYHEKMFKLLNKWVKLAQIFTDTTKTPYGYVFYPILDFLYVLGNDYFKNLPQYYNECIKALKDAKERYKSKSRGIFKVAVLRRINLELSRVTILQRLVRFRTLKNLHEVNE